jgi:hypothetical protein
MVADVKDNQAEVKRFRRLWRSAHDLSLPFIRGYLTELEAQQEIVRRYRRAKVAIWMRDGR